MPTQLDQEVAQRLAQSLPNASELLAQRVISLSRKIPTEKAFVNAARAFGRFDDSFLTDLHRLIASQPNMLNTNHAPAPSDSPASSHVQHAEPQRARAGLSTLGGEKHVFRAPTR